MQIVRITSGATVDLIVNKLRTKALSKDARGTVGILLDFHTLSKIMLSDGRVYAFWQHEFTRHVDLRDNR